MSKLDKSARKGTIILNFIILPLLKYEIKSGYSTTIESNKKETIDGKEVKWIYITKPVKGFIFGDKFIYRY